MDHTAQPARDVDVLVIGAGIVGLATAHSLQSVSPGIDIMVLDKEAHLAAHQSSHNSGVVHSGLYYPTGSDKAALVARGRQAMIRFAQDHGVPVDVCGKVVVAVATGEVTRLLELRDRADANRIEVELVDRRGLEVLEPHVEGLLALRVPGTAVIDFPGVCDALADEVRAAGGQILLGAEVRSIESEGNEGAHVVTDSRSFSARAVVGCAGLHSDHLARSAGIDLQGVRVLPFRGEYWELVPDRRHLVNHLVYPVPDPRFPFLGVHFTRGVDGEVHVGPNAVAALAREGYGWRDVEPGQVAEMLREPAWRNLARRYPLTGGLEMLRSASASLFLAAAQRLVPDLRRGDLVRAGSGVRAQAVGSDGTLLDDFAFVQGPSTVFVLNAPSPAATAALAIGDEVARRVLDLVASP